MGELLGEITLQNAQMKAGVLAPTLLFSLGDVGGQLFQGIFTSTSHYSRILLDHCKLNVFEGGTLKERSGFDRFLEGLDCLPRGISEINLSNAEYTPDQMGRLFLKKRLQTI